MSVLTSSTPINNTAQSPTCTCGQKYQHTFNTSAYPIKTVSRPSVHCGRNKLTRQINLNIKQTQLVISLVRLIITSLYLVNVVNVVMHFIESFKKKKLLFACNKVCNYILIGLRSRGNI